MKNIFLLIVALLLCFSCEKKADENVETDVRKSAASIFLLNSNWETQKKGTIKLKDMKGKNIVAVMIFTSCKTACPLLVADMKNIYSKMSEEKRKETTMLMISIDPENDTPEVLQQYAADHGIDNSDWLFIRSDMESTRELANVLAVKYKKISPIVFSHSNIITVFNKKGEMVKQVEGTVKADEVAEAVNSLP